MCQVLGHVTVFGHWKTEKPAGTHGSCQDLLVTIFAVLCTMS